MVIRTWRVDVELVAEWLVDLDQNCGFCLPLTQSGKPFCFSPATRQAIGRGGIASPFPWPTTYSTII